MIDFQLLKSAMRERTVTIRLADPDTGCDDLVVCTLNRAIHKTIGLSTIVDIGACGTVKGIKTAEKSVVGDVVEWWENPLPGDSRPLHHQISL